MKNEFQNLLKQMVEQEASDLYILEGERPFVRVNDRVSRLDRDQVTEEEVDTLLDLLMDEEEKRNFHNEKEKDFSYEDKSAGRFRVNAYVQRGNIGLVFRHVRRRIPDLNSLNLPVEPLRTLAGASRGLILVTGPAGSGKSTTIASMLELINQRRKEHIITIEDPIEYLFENKKSIISQREVGLDTDGFHSALKHVIRQAPDIIFIGEMRDRETMEAAMMAAETGHLVFSTLHTINASHTVERVINFFPSNQHDQIRLQLSRLLEGTIALRLLPRRDEEGRVPACELMFSAPRIRKRIRTGASDKLREVIEEGDVEGMQTFDDAIADLYERNLIDEETAMNAADQPEELSLRMQDIYTGQSTHEPGSD